MSDQVSNLAPHCDEKNKSPGTEQNRPHDRNIKHGKECHHKSHDECPCEGVPRYMTAKTIDYFQEQINPRWICNSTPIVLGKVFGW